MAMVVTEPYVYRLRVTQVDEVPLSAAFVWLKLITSTANQVYAMVGQTTYLPIIAAYSNDQDGSERIKLELTGFN